MSQLHVRRMQVQLGDCDPENRERIRAIPIPEDIKALCL